MKFFSFFIISAFFVFFINLNLFAQVNNNVKDTISDEDDIEIQVLPESQDNNKTVQEKTIQNTNQDTVKLQDNNKKNIKDSINDDYEPRYTIKKEDNSNVDKNAFQAIFVNGKIKWVRISDTTSKTTNNPINTSKSLPPNKNISSKSNQKISATPQSKENTKNKTLYHYKAIISNGKVKWIKEADDNPTSTPPITSIPPTTTSTSNKKKDINSSDRYFISKKEVKNSIETPTLAKYDLYNDTIKHIEPTFKSDSSILFTKKEDTLKKVNQPASNIDTEIINKEKKEDTTLANKSIIIEKTQAINKSDTVEITKTKKYIGYAIYRIQLSSTKKAHREEIVRENCNVNDEIIVSFENNVYKYMIGNFSSFQEALDYLNNFKKHGGCEDAFIVAYYQNKRISKEEAIQINGK